MIPDNCTNCSVCSQNCPAEAITIDEEKGAIVDPRYCLLCFKCEENCPINAYSYQAVEKVN